MNLATGDIYIKRESVQHILCPNSILQTFSAKQGGTPTLSLVKFLPWDIGCIRVSTGLAPEPEPLFVDVYGHLGIDSRNRVYMKNWFWRGHGTWAPRFHTYFLIDPGIDFSPLNTTINTSSGKDLWLLCQCKDGVVTLKVHKIENFFGSDFEICTFS